MKLSPEQRKETATNELQNVELAVLVLAPDFPENKIVEIYGSTAAMFERIQSDLCQPTLERAFAVLHYIVSVGRCAEASKVESEAELEMYFRRICLCYVACRRELERRKAATVATFASEGSQPLLM